MKIIVFFGPNMMNAQAIYSNIVGSLPPSFFGKGDLFYFLDYPGFGMSADASLGLPSVVDAAYNLYEKALESRSEFKLTDKKITLWVMTFSIGMGIFSEILPKIKNRDDLPDRIVSVNGLLSMRKAADNLFRVGGVIGTHLNMARGFSDRMRDFLAKPDFRFYIFQAPQDEVLDVENVKEVVTRWKIQEKIETSPRQQQQKSLTLDQFKKKFKLDQKQQLSLSDKTMEKLYKDYSRKSSEQQALLSLPPSTSSKIIWTSDNKYTAGHSGKNDIDWNEIFTLLSSRI